MSQIYFPVVFDTVVVTSCKKQGNKQSLPVDENLNILEVMRLDVGGCCFQIIRCYVT